jgi:hypothetical protein
MGPGQEGYPKLATRIKAPDKNIYIIQPIEVFDMLDYTTDEWDDAVREYIDFKVEGPLYDYESPFSSHKELPNFITQEK